jgi:hypothetical protein
VPIAENTRRKASGRSQAVVNAPIPPVLAPPIARSLGSSDSLIFRPSRVPRRCTSGSSSSRRNRDSRSFKPSNSTLRSNRGFSGGWTDGTVPDSTPTPIVTGIS